MGILKDQPQIQDDYWNLTVAFKQFVGKDADSQTLICVRQNHSYATSSSVNSREPNSTIRGVTHFIAPILMN